MKHTRVFHLLEGPFFCEGSTKIFTYLQTTVLANADTVCLLRRWRWTLSAPSLPALPHTAEAELRLKELRVLKDILKLRSKEFELPTTKEFSLMQWGNKPKEFDKSMILEESDVLRITDHAQAKYRSICLIAIYSGLRLADIVSLCPKEVDLKEGWIRKY